MTKWKVLLLLLFLSCVIVEERKTEPPSYYITKREFFHLVTTGVPEAKIETLLLKNKQGFSFTAKELLKLKKLGVSNHLIRVAMHPERFQKRKVKKTKEKAKPSPPKKPEKKPKEKPKYPSLFYYGQEEEPLSIPQGGKK